MEGITPVMWLRRVWVVVRTYWLAYAIVAVVGALFVSQGQWVYVVVWATMLAVITAVLAIVLARDEVSWETLTAGVHHAELPRLGEVYGLVRTGTFERHVLRIVMAASSPECVIRMRSLDVLRWRELRVVGGDRGELISLIRDGYVGLIDGQDLTRDLQRVYFPGRRARSAGEVNLRELRG